MEPVWDRLNVSRETTESLRAYESLLKKWNPRINLIAPSTVDEIWQRHFADSAKIANEVIGCEGKWVDLGTGAGFPALVIAMIAKDRGSSRSPICVEVDRRKCEFLKTAAREMDLKVHIRSDRIEKLEPMEADVITARALAPLTKLLSYCCVHLTSTGTAFLHKGRNWMEEVKAARLNWGFELQVLERGPEGSVILKIQDLVEIR